MSSNQFKPTYLYIKTHNKTGLKYFGKTIRDPFKYPGSGTYWRNHIKKYGKDVKTEIYGFYTDENECYSAAIKFSENNNIVLSTSWANLVTETGLDPAGSNIAQQNKLSQKLKKLFNITIDEFKAEVIFLYLECFYSVHLIAWMFRIRHQTITKVLLENNIKIRKNGGNSAYRNAYPIKIFKRSEF